MPIESLPCKPISDIELERLFDDNPAVLVCYTEAYRILRTGLSASRWENTL